MVLRRLFDFVVALAAIVVLSPLIAVISLVILFESGRPVLFAQERLTRNGRVFRMYKFRKFRAQEKTSGCPLTLNQDQRLTRLGTFLCATKLDELPQLWNVLKGDMGIVGPRPESVAFADCFQSGHEELLDHTPGLLGPAQICFRNEAELFPSGDDPVDFYRTVLFPLKAQIDLKYYRRRSVLGDVGWITLGVLAVLGLRFRSQLPEEFNQFLVGRRGS